MPAASQYFVITLKEKKEVNENKFLSQQKPRPRPNQLLLATSLISFDQTFAIIPIDHFLRN